MHTYDSGFIKISQPNKRKVIITNQLEKSRAASRQLAGICREKTDQVILNLADQLSSEADTILSANVRDLEKMDPSDPKYDRLKLTRDRLEEIARDLRNVASLASPLGKVLSEYSRPDGLKIRKVSVPFGVIGIIFEARPNVTFDVFSLCLKSGNACVLKGGSDAINSNTAIVHLIQKVLIRHDLDPEAITLLPGGREETAEMLEARGYIDLIIPRGSQALIDFVREHALVPVIETGAGICHTYFDQSGDTAMGAAVVCNAKTRRPSVCNALDCLLIHQSRLADLPILTTPLADARVTLYADPPAFQALEPAYPPQFLEHASPGSFGTEFLSLRMAIKTVGSLREALEHIATYSSGHSEAILTEDPEAASHFLQQVDAAAVYVNASTAFTDGAQFGLGAEMGISTQKLHARGPMGLEALTSYKWMITGNGHTRPA